MNIVLGSGNNRRVFTIPQGREMKALAREKPIEHAKIVGNLKALVRKQKPIRVKGKIAKALKG